MRIRTFLAAFTVSCAGLAAEVFAADTAYERGLVDRVQAAFAPAGPIIVDGLPVHRLCGTPLLLEIRLNWSNLSEATRAELASVVQFERPDLPEVYDTPDGLFRLHFARTGENAVNMSFGVGPGNVPNYVLNCADILEHVVAKEIDTLQFRFPISDSVPPSEEDPRFDVYFDTLGTQFYGLTYPETIIDNGQDAWWATSYMVLHCDYTQLQGYETRPFDAMAVTAAHEFHHASQWSYDAYEGELRNETLYPWWLEVSATAMEEIVYDHVNDYYAYLPTWFNNPQISLRAYANSASPDGLHPYASCIWALYLVQQHGEDIMREIWEECGEVDGFNTFSAFDTVLARRSETFRDNWAEFLVWNFFTGERAAGWNYEEASNYPMFNLPLYPGYAKPLDPTYPVADTSQINEYPRSTDELAAAYMRFESLPSDTSTSFKIILSAHNGQFDDWMAVTAGINATLKPQIATSDFFQTIEVADWDSYDEILVIATPFKPQPTQEDFDRRLDFRFEVADTLQSGATFTGIRTTRSNPLILSAGAFYEVQVSRAESVPVTMRIFTISGAEVRGGEKDNDASNSMHVSAGRSDARMRWDGTTSAGQPVATGVYLALVQIGDQHEVLKVAVKNQTK